MFQKKLPQKRKINSGGFVFVEFAIALPLLIFLMYGLSLIGVKIFELSKEQIADYVLVSEAQYVMERITREARAAKKVVADNTFNTITGEYKSKITIFYRVVEENAKSDTAEYIDDVRETQIFAKNKVREYPDLYRQRQDSDYTSPITGNNYFGRTRLSSFAPDLDECKKILHVELEMESVVTNRKIKIATAVFMPGYEHECEDGCECAGKGDVNCKCK